MKQIKLKLYKSSKNDCVFDYEYITIVSKDVLRVAEVDEMPWGDTKKKGKIYEYEYLVIGDGCLFNITEVDFIEIVENYIVCEDN